MTTSSSTKSPSTTLSLREPVSVANVLIVTAAALELISTMTSPEISTPGIPPPASRCSAARPMIATEGWIRNCMSIEPDAEPIRGISVLTAPAMRMPSVPAMKVICPAKVMTSLIVIEPAIIPKM